MIAGALVTLILINVVAAVFETVASLAEQYGWLFRGVETTSLVIFSAEYLVRLWVSVEHPRARGRPAWRARLAYAVTPAAIVDLIAILPFFIEAFTDTHLRIIVLVRLLRLFKLGRYSTGFQSLFEALRRERQALLQASSSWCRWCWCRLRSPTWRSGRLSPTNSARSPTRSGGRWRR
ncbi:MAG: ion transporter [Bauldia sp.]